MKHTLEEWLSWQEQLHLSEIDLGLDRIRHVAKNLDLLTPTFPIITVAGTNGKGSSVAMLDAILRAQGYKVGAYTSPHLIDYNERIRIKGENASDQQIISAFEAINIAREDITLTYFEFSALAAMYCFSTEDVDVAVLEVGLGGRLDASNLWDTSLAIITNIGIDHTDWLGDDREKIAFEKSGIMRQNTHVVCGDLNPPKAIKEEAKKKGAILIQVGTDFNFHSNKNKNKIDTWLLNYQLKDYFFLKPKLAGSFQLNNAATAITALLSIRELLPVSHQAIEKGLSTARISGRLELIHQSPDWLLDVAHNPHAAKELAKHLKNTPCSGKTYALFSMLKDKDIEKVISIMSPYIDEWHIAPLNGSRGLSTKELNQKIKKQSSTIDIIFHSSFNDATLSLKNITNFEDRVVAFGSFLVISAILELDYMDK